jgi:hypothetical protein
VKLCSLNAHPKECRLDLKHIKGLLHVLEKEDIIEALLWEELSGW